ncbi:MAG TPA: carboxypeptidase-like regulatory domain-containing protein, partial [Blastocatellia bacterium]|nr:carboxypeptidase-like regulatory domain-containing protein [Blastocatellia bacterium]
MAAKYGLMRSEGSSRQTALLLMGLLVFAAICPAVTRAESLSKKSCQTQAAQSGPYTLSIKGADENGVAVEAAIVTLTPVGTGNPLKADTDFAGKALFENLTAVSYEIKIAREGFYETVIQAESANAQTVEAVLNHVQELKEVMNVVSSAPGIAPEKTSTTEQLSGQEIIDLPYKTGRDIKNAFPLMPGIVQDSAGAFHVNGAQTRQTNNQLDGFDITNPETGTINLHVSADAVRSIEALT